MRAGIVQAERAAAPDQPEDSSAAAANGRLRIIGRFGPEAGNTFKTGSRFVSVKAGGGPLKSSPSPVPLSDFISALFTHGTASVIVRKAVPRRNKFRASLLTLSRG